MINVTQRDKVILEARKLGYRLPMPDSDRMIKPFGHSLYVLFVKGEDFRLNSYFYARNGTLSCWDSIIFSEYDIANNFQFRLSQAEEGMMHDAYPVDMREIGFLTGQEQAEILCGL
jgi:hypothetical protein